MPQTVDLIAPVQRLSPEASQSFFGYYDLPAADWQGRHLGQRVGFRDRLPCPGDRAELGWMPLPGHGEAGSFHLFGETLSWNFQQGAMLQWLAQPAGACLYNVFREGRFGACVHHLDDGSKRWLPRPVANVSRDGTRALCINMARVYDFRPGYGYEEIADPHAKVDASEDDGVEVMDLQTGEHRLVLSLAEAVRFLEAEGEPLSGAKVVINHITFNPSGSRYLFLLRSFPQPGQRWLTWLLTADTDGGGLRNHPVYGIASHYHWRNDEEMLFYAKPEPGDRMELFVIHDRAGPQEPLDPGFFRSDGHCSYSPDGRWLLYDSYWDASTPDALRSLYLYSLGERRGVLLGRFRSEALPRENVDRRCDLHPRWMPDGRAITFDSVHEGFRGIYWMDVSGVVAG
jgi:hypothetical protein